MIGPRLTWARVLPVVVLSVFVCALIIELVQPLLGRSGPPAEAFAQAAREHRALLTPGTRVLVHPPWRDDALDALSLPEGVRGTLALSTKHGAHPGRVVVVADPAWSQPAARLRLSRVVATGPVEVRLIERTRPAGKIVLDDDIGAATVHVLDKAGKKTECAFDGSRHACPGLQSWMWVGGYDMGSGGASRRCLWSHPNSGGQVVTRFPARVLGETLVFEHALADRVARSGAPVRATVSVDGKKVGELTRDPNPGFKKHTVKIGAADEPRVVEVSVTTRDAGARHYCFTVSSARGEAKK